MFRNLKADEIEVRVQQCKANGCVLLLYKDARCDMNILDETVGAMNWKRDHVRDNKNCIVSIWSDELKQWVSKEDTGTESNTEGQKGLASDSFKRACFNWGIGRELYSAPFTWVNLNSNEVNSYNGKHKLDFKVKFRVSEIEVSDNKHITKLVIVDQNNNIRFSTEKKVSTPKPNNKPENKVDPNSVFDKTYANIVDQYLNSDLMTPEQKQTVKDKIRSGEWVQCKNLVDMLIANHGALN